MIDMLKPIEEVVRDELLPMLRKTWVTTVRACDAQWFIDRIGEYFLEDWMIIAAEPYWLDRYQFYRIRFKWEESL